MDSLELLLDTICNVFGGIILVAILVVLQTQVTAEAVGHTIVPDARVKQAEYEVGKAARELASLQAELDALTTTTPALDRAVAATGRKSEFLDAIEAAQRQLERERLIAADTKSSRVEAEAKLEAEGERLRRLGKDVEEARARAGAVPEAFRRDVRLPIWHDQVAPLQRSLLIDGTLVYGLPEECTVEVVALSARRYRPRAGAGTRVGDPAGSGQVLAALMAGHTPRNTYISFWVTDRSDSFETFQLLRAAAVALTYEYTVSAFVRSEGLVLHPGRPKAE